jgi:hypothetical protein
MYNLGPVYSKSEFRGSLLASGHAGNSFMVLMSPVLML